LAVTNNTETLITLPAGGKNMSNYGKKYVKFFLLIAFLGMSGCAELSELRKLHQML